MEEAPDVSDSSDTAPSSAHGGTPSISPGSEKEQGKQENLGPSAMQEQGNPETLGPGSMQEKGKPKISEKSSVQEHEEQKILEPDSTLAHGEQKALAPSSVHKQTKKKAIGPSFTQEQRKQKTIGMQEQGKKKSLGLKSIIQEQGKKKSVGLKLTMQEQGEQKNTKPKSIPDKEEQETLAPSSLEKPKKKRSSGQSSLHEQKKQKALGPSTTEEQGKQKTLGINTVQGPGKNTARCTEAGKGNKVSFTSDAERKLDGDCYRLGDMVWAKVKSHPWWPGQLYDPDLAASSAMDFKRDSCFLVAFFGDSTFGWFSESELIPFEPNFAQKSKQTTAHNFVDAVEDALDEVRRRVKSGLTCHCCISTSTHERRQGRRGLLYDRQVREARSTFEPSELVTFMKHVACSPFSSSQNMLRTTVAGAQAHAFRVSAFCNQNSKYKEIFRDFGETIQNHQIDMQGLDDSRMADNSKETGCKFSMNQGHSFHKSELKKSGVTSALQEEEDQGGDVYLKGKDRELLKLEKVKQQATSSVVYGTGKIKKRSMDKKVRHEGKTGTKGTSSKSKGSRPAEGGIVGSNTLSTGFSEDFQASTGYSLDASKEKFGRGLGRIGKNFGQTENYKASAVCDGSTQDSLGSEFGKDFGLPTENQKGFAAFSDAGATESLQTKFKKNLGPVENHKVVAVSEADATESHVLIKKSTALKRLMKKEKDVHVEADQFSNAKRIAEDEVTKVCNVPSEKKRKRKILAGKNVFESSSKEKTGRLVVADSMARFVLHQQAEKDFGDTGGQESGCKEQHAEHLMSIGKETAEDSSAVNPEFVAEAGTLLQEVVQEKHEGNDVVGPVVGINELLKPGDLRVVEHNLESILQEENAMEASKEKQEDIVDTDTFKGVDLLASSGLCSERDTYHSVVGGKQDVESMDLLASSGLCSERDTYHSVVGGKQDVESMDTGPLVREDVSFKELKSSPVKVDSGLIVSHGANCVQSFVTCNALEGLQDSSHTKKEVAFPLKDGQEERKYSKKVKEVKALKSLPSSNNVNASKKRVFVEKECLLKDLRVKSKKLKTAISGSASQPHVGSHGINDAKSQFQDLAEKTKESVKTQDLHKVLMSIAAKPLDAIKEEFYREVHRAFTNFRKAVYQSFPDDPLSSVDNTEAAVPEADSRRVVEEFKQPALVTEGSEQAEMSSKRDGSFLELELSKVEDVRTEKSGIREASGQKRSWEDSFADPPKKSASSISLRPAIGAKVPVHSSRDVLDRFGQRIPRPLVEVDRISNHPSRVKKVYQERDLMITFPHGFSLPSEPQLRETLAKFGDLNVCKTGMDFNGGSARVVFRHTQNAEAALSFLKENPLYKEAHFSLKPRDVDLGELSPDTKESNSLVDKERPVLSPVDSQDTNIACEEGMLVSPGNDDISDVHIQFEDRSPLPHKSCLRKADDPFSTGKNGARVTFQLKHGVENAQSLLSTSASGNFPSADPVAFNSGHEKFPVDHSPSVSATPSSSPRVLLVGPKSLGPPVSNDIGDRMMLLLHQVHDLVGSSGFVL